MNLKWEDDLRSGVQNQLGQHSETLFIHKILKNSHLKIFPFKVLFNKKSGQLKKEKRQF